MTQTSRIRISIGGSGKAHLQKFGQSVRGLPAGHPEVLSLHTIHQSAAAEASGVLGQQTAGQVEGDEHVQHAAPWNEMLAHLVQAHASAMETGPDSPHAHTCAVNIRLSGLW